MFDVSFDVKESSKPVSFQLPQSPSSPPLSPSGHPPFTVSGVLHAHTAACVSRCCSDRRPGIAPKCYPTILGVEDLRSGWQWASHPGEGSISLLACSILQRQPRPSAGGHALGWWPHPWRRPRPRRRPHPSAPRPRLVGRGWGHALGGGHAPQHPCQQLVATPLSSGHALRWWRRPRRLPSR